MKSELAPRSIYHSTGLSCTLRESRSRDHKPQKRLYKKKIDFFQKGKKNFEMWLNKSELYLKRILSVVIYQVLVHFHRNYYYLKLFIQSSELLASDWLAKRTKISGATNHWLASTYSLQHWKLLRSRKHQRIKSYLSTKASNWVHYCIQVIGAWFAMCVLINRRCWHSYVESLCHLI